MQGSVINRIMEQSKQPEPELGMGVTICMWSDRHAGTIVGMSRTKHRLAVQADTATMVGGSAMSESQEYCYERNPEAGIQVFTRRKNGSYRRLGGNTGLLIGHREEYRDPTF